MELRINRLIKNNSLEFSIPNEKNPLRIYLSSMVTNCNRKWSFSTFEMVKNQVRNIGTKQAERSESNEHKARVTKRRLFESLCAALWVLDWCSFDSCFVFGDWA